MGTNTEKYKMKVTERAKLQKSDVGGMIFGCTNVTKDECLRKQLFGLPANHRSSVENIEPGMPLFLFNYSTRMLDGIYEAACQGQMEIDLNAWPKNSRGRTQYPAQVRFRTRIQCLPLLETQFSKIIKNNYFTDKRFSFELDHEQTNNLITLFRPLHAPLRKIPVANPSMRELAPGLELDWSSKEPEVKEPASCLEVILPKNNVQHSTSGVAITHLDANASEMVPRQQQTLIADCPSVEGFTDDGNTQGVLERLKLVHDRFVLDEENITVENLSTDIREKVRLPESSRAELEHHTTLSLTSPENTELVQIIQGLKFKTEALERKQVESDLKMLQLRNESGKAIEELVARVTELESKQSIVGRPSNMFADGYFRSGKVIYLIGGYDGSTGLPSLDSFSPSLDIVKPLKSTSVTVNPFSASAAALNGNIYISGGGDGKSVFDTVQCYSPKDDVWTTCPNLICPKDGHAGVTMEGKIYAIGGRDPYSYFSDVEMFDPALGRWINVQPMLQKRHAHAAAELHGVIYAIGGYDGTFYLRSVERYDPRTPYWMSVPSMETIRAGGPSVVLNDKIYAMGGCTGEETLRSVETFDPRLGAWMASEPMTIARGYSAAAVLEDSVLVIGGMQDNEQVLDTVECYKEGTGWTGTGLKSVGKRAVFSAIVL